MLCNLQNMVSILRVASWLQNFYCSSGNHIRITDRKKEEGEAVKGTGEKGRKRLRGKEGHVKSTCPGSQSIPLLRNWPRSLLLGSFQGSGNLPPINFSLYLIPHSPEQHMAMPVHQRTWKCEWFCFVFKPAYHQTQQKRSLL